MTGNDIIEYYYNAIVLKQFFGHIIALLFMLLLSLFWYYMIILSGHIVAFYYNMLALLFCFCYYICMISILLIFHFVTGSQIDRIFHSAVMAALRAARAAHGCIFIRSKPKWEWYFRHVSPQAMRKSNTARKFASNNFVSNHMFLQYYYISPCFDHTRSYMISQPLRGAGYRCAVPSKKPVCRPGIE